MNQIVLLGRACADPEFRYGSSGTAVAKFTLAVDRKYSRQQKEQLQKDGKQTSDFIRIVGWGYTAEHAERFLRKGARVLVNGTLCLNKFDKENGETVYYTAVHAERLQVLDYHDRKNDHVEDAAVCHLESERALELSAEEGEQIMDQVIEESALIDDSNSHLYEA